MSKGLAVELCTEIYEESKGIGWYPALTGGSLYKEGPRKDIDIVFFTNRQQSPTKIGLLKVLNRIVGLKITRVCPSGIIKGAYKGKAVDLLFPEDPKGNPFKFNPFPDKEKELKKVADILGIDFGWVEGNGGVLNGYPTPGAPGFALKP